MILKDRSRTWSRVAWRQSGRILKARDGVRFEVQKRQQVYRWVNETLRRQNYRESGRTGRGLDGACSEGSTGLRWVE